MNRECVFTDDHARPRALHKFVFCDQFACGLDQNFDDVERTTSEWDRRAPSTQLMPRKVPLPCAQFINTPSWQFLIRCSLIKLNLATGQEHGRNTSCSTI